MNVPVVLGHEFGGTIARLGRAVRGFSEGDRVVSETAAEICGECMLCRTGRYNLCPSRKGFGYGVNGAMAQYVRVPARCLHHIPDTLPFDLACLAEPHAVAYNAMCMNATIRPGDAVVVLGPGPIGLLCARMAALAGARPADRRRPRRPTRARLEAARRLGATHVVDVQTQDIDEIVRGLSPLGADVVCDASGASDTLSMALRLARSGRPGHQGRLVAGRRSHGPQSAGPEEPAPAGIVQPQLSDLGARDPSAGPRHDAAAEIIGLRAPLDGWRGAFDAMHERRVIKSVIVPGAGS